MWLLLSPLQIIVSSSLSHRVQIQYHQIYSTWRKKIWHWILIMKNHILKLSWGPEKYSLSALQEILCASSILLPHGLNSRSAVSPDLSNARSLTVHLWPLLVYELHRMLVLSSPIQIPSTWWFNAVTTLVMCPHSLRAKRKRVGVGRREIMGLSYSPSICNYNLPIWGVEIFK